MSSATQISPVKVNKQWIVSLAIIAALGMVFYSFRAYGLPVPTNTPSTIISAHRGGRAISGYPENALETFALTRSQVPNAWIECDINMSRDSVLFILHDASLDRTTTGTGLVKRLNWNQIDTCHLVDDFKGITTWQVPTLEETLEWAEQDNATLVLDVKRGVPYAQVLALVEASGLIDQCVIVVYNATDALQVHQLNKRVRISTNIRNEEELQRHIQLGIPLDRLYAFVGTRLPSLEHIERLKALNIPTILGSLGNLDQRAAAHGDELYCIWGEQFTVIATDRPVAVYEAIQTCP